MGQGEFSRAQWLCHKDTLKLNMHLATLSITQCHREAQGAPTPPATLVPQFCHVIPGGLTAARRPIGARSWYLLLVTGFTVATSSLGPCKTESVLWPGLVAPPSLAWRVWGSCIRTPAAGTWAAESCSFRICMASSWGSSFFPKSLLQRQHHTSPATLWHHLYPGMASLPS